MTSNYSVVQFQPFLLFLPLTLDGKLTHDSHVANLNAIFDPTIKE